MAKNNQDLMTESKENYLESVLKLSLKCNIEKFDDDTDKEIFHNEAINALLELQNNENVTLKSEVHAINIKDDLNYSKPSVSIAMHKLEANGYITIEKNGVIHLTDEGFKKASAVYERHKVLSTFLMNIGVSKETALEDACEIEHFISEETFEAVKKYRK